ncbi:DUF4864 domain-containing protein [uncultured Roseobacter sp.]|uniref:DUF4864 domain-containing protein n=1 Tax=uncultured Roseobacter sp. TaxID=114847 RepID=UPI00262883AE|nr:DUF4864 domain-containing protein [uncultured Roseobacter sp.]
MRSGIFAVIASLIMTCAAQAEPADIEATIDRQLQAFQADDFDRAFTFASPNLQRLFQSPQNFQRMVTQGYPMVWRFSEFRFLELREESGAFWQRVMITDEKGTVHILDYRMLETAEGWRINGVQILDSSEMNA